MKKIYFILITLVVLLISACGSDKQKNSDIGPVAADSIETDTTSNSRSVDTAAKPDSSKPIIDSVTKNLK